MRPWPEVLFLSGPDFDNNLPTTADYLTPPDHGYILVPQGATVYDYGAGPCESTLILSGEKGYISGHYTPQIIYPKRRSLAGSLVPWLRDNPNPTSYQKMLEQAKHWNRHGGVQIHVFGHNPMRFQIGGWESQGRSSIIESRQRTSRQIATYTGIGSGNIFTHFEEIEAIDYRVRNGDVRQGVDAILFEPQNNIIFHKRAFSNI